MSQLISILIPSYRNPTYLDLCLKSIYDNQVFTNQVLVCLDGFADESRDVVDKYQGLNVMALTENRGQIYAHNNLVINAKHPWVLVINDDNVVGKRFDERLQQALRPNHVIAPNQIEPAPSIFRSFIHQDFGTTPDTFDYDGFLHFEEGLLPIRTFADDGGTWPLLIEKKYYMLLNGIDTYFPSPAVADLDFFYRCFNIGLKIQRYYGCHVYHFAGAATKATPERAAAHFQKEQESWAYLNYKWQSKNISRDQNNLLNIV